MSKTLVGPFGLVLSTTGPEAAPVGVALPSTRELSHQLGVARNTVALAYELLVDEGYLVTRNRSGHFVNPEIVADRAAPPRASGTGAAPQVAWGGRVRP